MRSLRTPTGSDVTEHQELSEIHQLLSLANDRLFSGDLRGAKSLASEAIQIDDTHTEALKFLVEINIKLQRFEEAFYYAESLIDIHSDDPLGRLMKAKVEYEVKHYRDCINSSLKCLSMEYHSPREATNLIVKAVQGILERPDDFYHSLQDMDYYAQLGEIGLVLLSAKQMVMVVQILEVALQLQTNQFGVSMMIYLTQGHALCAIQQHEAALKAYENCLNTAISTHDISHQTKALVNVAALHVSQGNTYKALVVYERLLDMHSCLLSDAEVCEDVWTVEFISGLYMNTSIAYRNVGNLDMALHYADRYLDGITDSEDYSALGLIHRHIGTLNETVGHYSMALSHYKSYLAMAKCSADRLEIARAYGHLGSLFGQIGLWPMSIVYHDRHVSGVSSVLNSTSSAEEHGSEISVEARKAAVQAYEMYGDTLMRKVEYEEASNMYITMSRFCDRSTLNRCRSLYKTANTHLYMGKSQHALHYYEQALNLCDEEFVQLMDDIRFGMALSMQSALTSGDLEKGKKYFQQSIASFKSQIEECLEHHKFLPRELVTKLNRAFQGIQMVLARLGCDLECLEYAEEARIFTARLFSEGAPFPRLPARLDASSMINIVRNQGATVLYYSFLNSTLLMWIFTPDKGFTRFYVKKAQTNKGNVEEELQAMISPWLQKLTKQHSKQLYKCEHRNIERKQLSKPVSVIEEQVKGDILRRESSWTRSERGRLKSEGDRADDSAVDSESGDETQIERKLYKFLASPVDDILANIPHNGRLIVIPDKAICQIPFSRLRDLKGKPLADKFNITYLSGLFALKLVIENQILNLQAEDEVNFFRAESSLGGYYRYLHAQELQYSNEESAELSGPPPTDRRRVANPRLDVILRSQENKSAQRKQLAENLEEDNTRRLEVNSNALTGRFVQLSTNGEMLQRAHTFHEGASERLYSLPHPVSPRHTTKRKHAPKSANPIPQPCYHKPRVGCGNAASICKLLRTDNLSTLITTSSTGTDTLSSTTAIPEYSQISNKENFVVIGNPYLSSQMLLGTSRLPTPEAYAYKLMMSELQTVSEILGCDYIFDKQATKSKFIEMACKASVLHIVSQASLQEGFILMSADDNRLSRKEPVGEKYYLVTADEIARLRMRAKLVVISGGWSVRNLSVDQESLQKLPNAFLLAGAESVLTIPHPQTSEVMAQFYRLFYTSFQWNSDVCTALNGAARKVTSKHGLPLFPAHLYGNNVNISITDVKSAMLDQNLDEIEAEINNSHPIPPLNESLPEDVPTVDEMLTSLQTCIGEICGEDERIFAVVNDLLLLVKDAITIVEESLLQVPNLVVLSSSLISYSPAIHLLKLLKFNFEPRGMTQKQCEPAVLFPSWDPDGLLPRALDCLQAILETKEKGIHSALHDLLPIEQKTISRFIDVLALALHSPSIQLNIKDDTLYGLWINSNCRHLLQCVGFHQIGTILHFNTTRQNQKLLKSVLKLFVMMSVSKPESLLSKLDIYALCGGQQKLEVENMEGGQQLSTLLPTLLPKDKLMRRVPWSSRIESLDEMKNKTRLAQRYWKNEDRFNTERKKLLQLELSTARVQAQEVLSDYALPKKKPDRVKVHPGSTGSRNRVAVNYVPPLTSIQFEQRRKYSDYLQKTRMQELAVREKHDNRILLRSYTDIIN